MRILHLAYEDPAQPGSGGGAIRTREINRRLSTQHEITALVAAYPGAQERVEDGVHWIPLGPPCAINVGRLTYFGLLAQALQRYTYDLVVEDFGAPFSVGFSPLFTTKPVIASVQWLFAAHMRDKYHLPFDWVERCGLPFYHDFLAVSHWLAAVLRQHQPSARITVLPNGIDELAFTMPMATPKHLLFVGRLDSKQKGCDMLLTCLARARQHLGNQFPPVILVGDGPDTALLHQQTQQLGLQDVVHFAGRVEGRAKYQLMAEAYAVLMPSRFETFGMVATESQAVGVPIIAFDVGPLAEVVGPEGARLVAPFDQEAFAREIVTCVRALSNRAHVHQHNRSWAQQYNWDHIALQQEGVYHSAVANHAAHASSRRNSGKHA